MFLFLTTAAWNTFWIFFHLFGLVTIEFAYNQITLWVFKNVNTTNEISLLISSQNEELAA